VNHGLAQIVTQSNESSASRSKRPISRLAFLQQREPQQPLVLQPEPLVLQPELQVLRQERRLLQQERRLLQQERRLLQQERLALRLVLVSQQPVFRQRPLRSNRAFRL
jgi:hypothetical protein